MLSRSQAADRIPQATQTKVFEAAARLKYEANALARGLRQKRSYTMGVLVPEISEGYNAAVLRGIEDALLDQGFFFFVVSHRHRPEILANYLRLFVSRSVEGIIAIDTPLEGGLGLPIASVSGHRRKDDIVNIVVDHEAAANLTFRHLAAMGHHKLAFIRGQSFSSDTRSRWSAFTQAARRFGVKIVAERVVDLVEAAPTSEPGYRAMLRLFEQTRDFTAVVAFNDISAIGAIQAIRERHLRVPRDISVIGFDDIPSAATNDPGLTTIRQPLVEMGRLAANTILAAIKGEQPVSSRTLTVQPTLVTRRSTGHLKHSDANDATAIAATPARASAALPD